MDTKEVNEKTIDAVDAGVDKGRRKVIKSVATGAAVSSLPAPWIVKSGFASDPIVLGLPIAQSTAGGVADHLDHLQGAILAQEEINAAGGILGRELKFKVVDIDIFSPEGCQTAMLKLVDEKVHAMTTAFTLAPIPTIDATVKYKAPLLWGVTQRQYADHVANNPDKYSHCFQTDPSEVHYGYTFPIFLKDMKDRGLWKPNNNAIHIVQEQIAYCQTISRTLQEAIPDSDFELAGVTDIQFPVQNWEPVIQEIKRLGAGAVMLDHWVAAEYAAFCKQWRADPLPNTLIYMQYGPSQPEFLDLAGPAAEGFIWSTVLGVYADEMGTAFREKYKKRWPGTMGLCYTGNAYDTVYFLKQAWEHVGDPNKFEQVCDYIRTTKYRGVCGLIDMNNKWQEGAHYPDNGHPVTAKNLEDGMGQLYVQVQNTEHKIVYPDVLKESELQPFGW